LGRSFKDWTLKGFFPLLFSSNMEERNRDFLTEALDPPGTLKVWDPFVIDTFTFHHAPPPFFLWRFLLRSPESVYCIMRPFPNVNRHFFLLLSKRLPPLMYFLPLITPRLGLAVVLFFPLPSVIGILLCRFITHKPTRFADFFFESAAHGPLPVCFLRTGISGFSLGLILAARRTSPFSRCIGPIELPDPPPLFSSPLAEV